MTIKNEDSDFRATSLVRNQVHCETICFRSISINEGDCK